jgi:peptidoglycan/xylan/chitin deacetylase (PgdA/CDA1 family)
LLARLIETLAPRPRLWYYPAADQHSVVIMTSDDDWSTVEQFEALLAGLRKRQAHGTFYVVPETKINQTLMDRWAAEGHTFSVHPALDSDMHAELATQDPQSKLVAAMLHANLARHLRDYGHTPQTIRQHAVRWLGYVDAARLLAELGIEMELNYISVHPFSLGYMAGSGRPLRFVDTDGVLINCYQQPTLWTEEVLIHPHFVFSFKWSVARALAETDKIIQRAAREFYTPIIFNSHPVSFATYSSPLIEGCWDTALAEGMQIVSADEWLAWTKARNSVQIEQETNGCTVYTPQAIPALTLLLPNASAPQADHATVSRQQLWGEEYMALTLNNLAAGERRRIIFA